MVPDPQAKASSRRPVPDWPNEGTPAVLQCLAPEILLRILDDDVGMVTWQRPIAPGHTPSPLVPLDAVPFSTVVEGRPDAVGTMLAAALPAPFPDLLDDVTRLAKLFAMVATAATVRARFDHVRDDACRCFHVDNVRLRLLCTYAGLGTQWQDRAGTIHQVATGAVTLLKGALFPDHAPRIPHRSPPLEHLRGAARSRLLLVIDQPGVF